MGRSLKKGPYVDAKLFAKIERQANLLLQVTEDFRGRLSSPSPLSFRLTPQDSFQFRSRFRPQLSHAGWIES